MATVMRRMLPRFDDGEEIVEETLVLMGTPVADQRSCIVLFTDWKVPILVEKLQRAAVAEIVGHCNVIIVPDSVPILIAVPIPVKLLVLPFPFLIPKALGKEPLCDFFWEWERTGLCILRGNGLSSFQGVVWVTKCVF